LRFLLINKSELTWSLGRVDIQPTVQLYDTVQLTMTESVKACVYAACILTDGGKDGAEGNEITVRAPAPLSVSQRGVRPPCCR
jgi:hypothetical protein